MYRAILVSCLCLAVSACGSTSPSTPTSPQTLDLSGTWSGDLAVTGATARMTWTLARSSATDVTGPVVINLPTGTVLLNGVLSGTLAGSTLTYTIAVGPGAIPSQPACTGQLAGSMTATIGVTSTLAGNIAVKSSTCTIPFSGGNLTLTRE
jgi:hypothetical protein